MHPQANWNVGRHGLLNQAMSNPAFRDMTIGMLRDFLSEAGFSENIIEQQLEKAVRSGKFTEGIGVDFEVKDTYQPEILKFSSEGNTLFTVQKDSTCRWWDLKSGNLIKKVDENKELFDERIILNDLQTMITLNKKEGIQFWETKNVKLLNTIKESEDDIESISMSPDGKILAIVYNSYDKPIKVCEVKTWARIPVKEEYCFGRPVFSPDGKYIARFSNYPGIRLENYELVVDKTPPGISIYATDTGRHIKRLINEKVGYLGLDEFAVFSLDGKFLARADKSYHNDNPLKNIYTIRVWEIESGELLHTTEDNSWIKALKFSPDGQYIISGCLDGTIKFWETRTGKISRIFKCESEFQKTDTISFSSNSYNFASLYDENKIRVWAVAGPQISRPQDLSDLKRREAKKRHVISSIDSYLTDLKYNDAYTLLISEWGKEGFGRSNYLFPYYNLLRGKGQFFGIETIIEYKMLLTSIESVSLVTFSDDQKYLAATGDDKKIWVWDMATFFPAKSIELNTPVVLRKNHPLSEELRLEVKEKADPNRKEKMNLGHLLIRFDSARELKKVYSFSFTPDGQKLAFGNGKAILIYDINQNQIVNVIKAKGHTVTFLKKEQILASASENSAIKIWEAESGKALQKIHPAGERMQTLACSSNGDYLASGGDHSVRVWLVIPKLKF